MTLIIGGVIGWLASMVMKTNAQMGILANVAVLGAVLLIAILQALGVFRRLSAVR